MILVSDASPLIFLNKIDQLVLPRILFHATCLIPETVYNEVVDSANEIEKTSLLKELKHWKVREVKLIHSPSGVGSVGDWSVFHLARSEEANVVLIDDKLLRGIVSSSGIRVLGTLGLLTLTVRRKLLTSKKAIELGTVLIEKHNLWVDALTYRMFIESIKDIR